MGSSDVDIALFGAKIIGFFEIYGVSATDKGGGGLSQCGYFADKGGGGVNFLRFLRTSFMDGPNCLLKRFYTLKEASR